MPVKRLAREGQHNESETNELAKVIPYFWRKLAMFGMKIVGLHPGHGRTDTCVAAYRVPASRSSTVMTMMFGGGVAWAGAIEPGGSPSAAAATASSTIPIVRWRSA